MEVERRGDTVATTETIWQTYEDKKKSGSKRYLQIGGLGFIAFVAILTIWTLWPDLFVSYAERATVWPAATDNRLVAMGQMGDSYGGFNALIGAVTLVGLGVSIALQVHGLNKRDAEQELERFDKIFARIMTSLENHVAIMSEQAIQANARHLAGSRVQGKEAFQVWTDIITQDLIGRGVVAIVGNEAQPLPNLTINHIREAYNDLFAKKPEHLAPYWRLLYHAFKTIKEKKISDDEKGLYADIVRADFTPSQSLLLAMNGIGRYGHEFIELINRYHLLKHIPQNFRKVFEAAYDESAFTDEELSQTQRQEGN